MRQDTQDYLSKILEVSSHLYELICFFEDYSQDENFPSTIRSSFENAAYELNDRYTDLDQCIRFLVSTDPDLKPRQTKEF